MAARLIESSFTNKRDIARITTSNSAVPMKKVADGTELKYVGYVIQEITNDQTGEVFNSIVIKTDDNKLYATRSETFIRSLKEILEICKGEDGEPDGDPIILKIERLESKNGNEFVTCALA